MVMEAPLKRSLIILPNNSNDSDSVYLPPKDFTKMKILVLTENFPPSSAISARRWGELAPLLSNKANLVSVLHREEDKFIIKELKSAELVSEMTYPDAGTVAKSESPRQKKQIRSTHTGFWFSNFVALPRVLDSSSLRWLRALTNKHLFDYIKTRGFDYVIASYGPGGPIALGYTVKVLLKYKLMIDFRDSFDAKRPLSGPLSSFSLLVERFLVNSADCRVTIGLKLSDYLSKTYKSSFSPIYNGLSDKGSNDVIDNSIATRFYYAGTIYRHRLASFKLLLSYLRQSPTWSLTVRLLGDNFAEVCSLVSASGLASRVEILPATTKQIIESELDDGSLPIVLEVLESGEPEWIYGNVTGKLFELASRYSNGLVIANPRSESFELAARINGWYAIGSEADFSKLSDDDCIDPNLKWREEFTFSRQTEALRKLIN